MENTDLFYKIIFYNYIKVLINNDCFQKAKIIINFEKQVIDTLKKQDFNICELNNLKIDYIEYYNIGNYYNIQYIDVSINKDFIKKIIF